MKIVAIDFGASTTKAAIRFGSHSHAAVVPFGADREFPTAVYLSRKGEPLVDHSAESYGGQDPLRLHTRRR
jgi:hypothetical protein